MSGGRGNSAWSAGCGAFGLLGLLLGVGLTVYLSGRVLNDTSGVVTPRDRDGKAPASETAAIEVEPAGPYSESQPIRVVGMEFPSGTEVIVRICARPEDAKPGCDSRTKVVGVSNMLGEIDEQLTARRLLQTKVGAFDCASKESHCEVRATTEDGATVATVALTFAA